MIPEEYRGAMLGGWIGEVERRRVEKLDPRAIHIDYISYEPMGCVDCTYEPVGGFR